jgi:glucokinase
MKKQGPEKPELYLGFDIGGTKCGVVLGNCRGEILASRTVPTDHTAGPYRIIDSLVDLARQIVATGNSTGKDETDSVVSTVISAGISCGGPLDSRTGVILSPPNLPGWDAVPVVDRMEQRLGIPVGLQNDANACALAEWRFGAGKGSRNMVFLTFGTGMGAGMILDGRLYTGTNDMAGEIGHVRMEKDGPLGYGKPGSFEGFCSGAGIGRLARDVIAGEWNQNRTVSFCPSPQDLEALTARDVGNAAQNGDPVALRILETSAEYLGRGLAVLIDIINPEVIVIGSIFVRLEALFRPRMEEVIRRESLNRAATVCRIVPAALGDSVGSLAALSVAVQAAEKGQKKEKEQTE